MPYYPQQPAPRPPGPPRRKRVLRLALLCCSFFLIAWGAAQLIRYVSDLASVRRTTQELREAAGGTPAPTGLPDLPAPEPSDPMPALALRMETVRPASTPDPSDRLPVLQYPDGYETNNRIEKLRKKSSYIIGWITMDDMDEPVVLKDNTFFLNHDAMGNRNSNGAIFLDESVSLVTRPYTLLLYGHNMKNGAMFGNLHRYKVFSYYYRHRMIHLDMLFEEGWYAVFAVSEISVVPGQRNFVNLADFQSASRKIRQKALGDLIGCSPHGDLLDVNEEDQILLLITCVGDDDERLIVAARRLREGETGDSLRIRQP